MVVLLTGATGFIGRHLAAALRVAGHRVRCAVRNPDRAKYLLPGCEVIAVDFARADTAEQWREAIRGVDAVINAVGIFQQQGAQTFDALHTRAPCALFAACAEGGIERVVQISALGAEHRSDVAFLDSKHMADRYLLQQTALRGVVLMPAPVFGHGGASALLFAQLASLPVLALPPGAQRIQPVHIDDVCAAVVQLVQNDVRGRIAAVGPEVVSVRDYLAILRQALGYRRAWVFGIPGVLLTFAQRLRSGWLDPDTLRMLARSRRADVAPFAQLLEHAPLLPAQFIDDAQTWRRDSGLPLAIAALRLSLALLWIVTGLVSLFVYPRALSYELLERSGFGPPLAAPLLVIAAMLDIAFGVSIYALHRGRRLLWLAQAIVIFGYTLIITWRLPEFWAHPYGPILKNLPILAAIAVLYVNEPPRSGSR